MCQELKERFEAFRHPDLHEIRLVALFLHARLIAVRPDGTKEGVQVAWGSTEDGERVLRLPDARPGAGEHAGVWAWRVRPGSFV
jgi:hypothetical protein